MGIECVHALVLNILLTDMASCIIISCENILHNIYLNVCIETRNALFFFFFLFRNFMHTYNLFGFRMFAALPGLPGLDIIWFPSLCSQAQKVWEVYRRNRTRKIRRTLQPMELQQELILN